MSNWAELYPTFSDANQARLQRPLTQKQQWVENPMAYPLQPEETQISAAWHLANAELLWRRCLDEADVQPVRTALALLEECAVQALLATKRTRTPKVFQSAVELLIQIERRRLDIVQQDSEDNLSIIESNIRHQLQSTRYDFTPPVPRRVGEPSKLDQAEKVLASHIDHERHRQIIAILKPLLRHAREAWANIDVETIIIPFTRDVSIDVRLIPNPVNDDLFLEVKTPMVKATIVARYFHGLDELRLTWESHGHEVKHAHITEKTGVSAELAEQLTQVANWLGRALERANRQKPPIDRLMTMSRKLTPEEEHADLEAKLENFKNALVGKKLPAQFEWLNGSLNQTGIKAKWVVVADTRREKTEWIPVRTDSQRTSSPRNLATFEEHISAKLFIIPQEDQLDAKRTEPQATIDFWVSADGQKIEDYNIGFYFDGRNWREVTPERKQYGLASAGDVVTSCRLLVEGKLPVDTRPRIAKKTEPLPVPAPQVRGKV